MTCTVPCGALPPNSLASFLTPVYNARAVPLRDDVFSASMNSTHQFIFAFLMCP